MPNYTFNQQNFEVRYPAVMGILNLTPDSFSDGGQYLDKEEAVEKAIGMYEMGAQIIDIGGESTRPGSHSISEQEELERVLPILEKLPTDQFLISVDTTKPAVAEASLQAGAHIINDVSGGNSKLIELANRYSTGYVIMHSQGEPENMQQDPHYQNAITEIQSFFEAKWKEFSSLELPRVWVDPGIGFGKKLQHNLEIMANLKVFTDERWGVLLGSSRKSWIDQLCDAPDPLRRLGGSLASGLLAVQSGIEILRVHDVQETIQCLKVSSALASFEKSN